MKAGSDDPKMISYSYIRVFFSIIAPQYNGIGYFFLLFN